MCQHDKHSMLYHIGTLIELYALASLLNEKKFPNCYERQIEIVKN